jgi:hypothetical protein
MFGLPSAYEYYFCVAVKAAHLFLSIYGSTLFWYRGLIS